MTPPALNSEEYRIKAEERLRELKYLVAQSGTTDQKLSANNQLLLEVLSALQVNTTAQLPAPLPAYPIVPYNVRKFSLDSARESPGDSVDIPGDTITVYTDGTLVGCFIRIDESTNDAIPLNEFNPYYYPAKFKGFYLETTAQTGKYIRIHIGREAGAEAAVEITATAPRASFYTVASDKDSHFTEALVTNAKEDENLIVLGSKVRITGVAIQADQGLDYFLMFWRKNTFESTNLDSDTFVGIVELNLALNGQRVGGANQFYMSSEGIDLDYEDEDGSNELHISLFNADAVSKIAGTTGEVVIFVKYELRT